MLALFSKIAKNFRTEIENPVADERIRQWLENFLLEQIDDIRNKLYICRLQIEEDFIAKSLSY